MQLRIIRDNDGKTLSIAGGFYAPFVMSPESVLASAELDITGYEFSGADGGYTTASRYQRRPLDLMLTVQEHHSTNKSLMDLLAELRSFLRPHNDRLEALTYTLDFITCDRNKTSFRLKSGAISAALTYSLNRPNNNAEASIGFIFGDPYAYHLAGAGIMTLTLFPKTMSGEPEGRLWSGRAVWEAGRKLWRKTDLTQSIRSGELLSQMTVPADVKMTGCLSRPRITNMANGSFVEYLGDIAAGETLSIVNGYATFEGSPVNVVGSLKVAAGKNTFSLSSDCTGGRVEITARGAL